MKVQLIHPPVYLNVHAMTALRPSLPLGLAYIAAALRKAGHTVTVIDAVGEAPERVTQGARKQLFALGLTVPEIITRLDDDADVIAVTNMWSFSWPLVRDLLSAIKHARPDTPLVCGGEHFTGLAEYSMQQAPIDVIVLGEGEDGAVDVVNELGKEKPDFSAIPSVVYRDAKGQPVRSLQVLNHLRTQFLRSLKQISRNITQLKLHALSGVIPIYRLHTNQINQTFKLLFRANRNLNWHYVCAQTSLHLLHNFKEVSSRSIHLVHKSKTWHLVFICLTPDSLRLGLHAAYSAINHARTI